MKKGNNLFLKSKEEQVRNKSENWKDETETVIKDYTSQYNNHLGAFIYSGHQGFHMVNRDKIIGIDKCLRSVLRDDIY